MFTFGVLGHVSGGAESVSGDGYFDSCDHVYAVPEGKGAFLSRHEKEV
jgi:hypothetical protein